MMDEVTSNVMLTCGYCGRAIRQAANPDEGWVHAQFDYQVATTDRVHRAYPADKAAKSGWPEVNEPFKSNEDAIRESARTGKPVRLP
jgi:hypothetical protein